MAGKSKIFVTGASGYLGGAITERLVRAGHEVFGLTRNSRHAETLERVGARPVPGDLTRPETFVGTLKNCDAAVHAAVADQGAPASLDRLALEAFADAAEDGRLRRLLYTSGVWVHGDQRGLAIDEATPLDPLELVAWRAAHEEVVMDLAGHEVVPVILRPAIVYGESRGILGTWFDEAHKRGTVSWYGSGEQHWGMVHRDDVARAYVLAMEHAGAGDRFLLADGSAHTVREMAEAVARVTGAKAQPWKADDVVATLGLFGRALLVDGRVNAARVRRELGWVPRHTSFVGEVDAMLREWQDRREARVT